MVKNYVRVSRVVIVIVISYNVILGCFVISVGMFLFIDNARLQLYHRQTFNILNTLYFNISIFFRVY